MTLFAVKRKNPVKNAPTGTPTAPVFGGHASSAPPKTVTSNAISQAQSSKLVNPRAPSTSQVAPTVGQVNSFDLGNLPSPTIGTSTFQVQNLPLILDSAGDITELEFDITDTFTGTVTTTIQFSSAFNRLTILNPNGIPIIEMPGGTAMQLWYIAHSLYNQNGNTDTVANQTTAQTASVVLPGVELPYAGDGNTYKVQAVFDTVTAIGGTQATADTLTARVGGLMGSAIHGTTNYYSTIFNLGAGVTYPSVTLPSQNVLIQKMYIWGGSFVTSDVSEWTITSNGSLVEPLVTGTQLAARQKMQFANNVPSGSLIYTPRTQWFWNSTSKWRLNMANARTNVNIGFEYYTPAGSNAT